MSDSPILTAKQFQEHFIELGFTTRLAVKVSVMTRKEGELACETAGY